MDTESLIDSEVPTRLFDCYQNPRVSCQHCLLLDVTGIIRSWVHILSFVLSPSTELPCFDAQIASHDEQQKHQKTGSIQMELCQLCLKVSSDMIQYDPPEDPGSVIHGCH